MSKNIVKAAIEFVEANDVMLGLIPSRRQIGYWGGYVGWNSIDFADFVRSRNTKLILERDHGGPAQGDKSDSGLREIILDAHKFDILHLDVWKQYPDLDTAVSETATYARICRELARKDIKFEVGTEQAIRPYSPEDLWVFLDKLSAEMSWHCVPFENIEYCVVQFGTAIEGSHNTGAFDEAKAKKMLEVCKEFGIKSKEHNGDYLTISEVKKRFDLGLDALNIAPEFGSIESKVYLQAFNDQEKERFFELCLESGRWKKWYPNGHSNVKPEDILTATGHYVFNDLRFQALKQNHPDIDLDVRAAIIGKLSQLCEAVYN